MPLDKLVLILVMVAAAAAVTVWLGVVLAATLQNPTLGWAIVIPVSLIAYVLWRVISDRVANKEDDHYDNVEK